MKMSEEIYEAIGSLILGLFLGALIWFGIAYLTTPCEQFANDSGTPARCQL